MTLIDRAKQIKNETTQGANTAERVGGWMVDACTEIGNRATKADVTALFDEKSEAIDKQLSDKEKEIDEAVRRIDLAEYIKKESLTTEITDETETIPSNYAVNTLKKQLYGGNNTVIQNFEMPYKNDGIADTGQIKTAIGNIHTKIRENLRGLTVRKIQLNVTTIGSLRLLICKNVQNSNFSYEVAATITATKTGFQEFDVNIPIGEGEDFGIGHAGDTMQWAARTDRVNPVGGAYVCYFPDTKEWKTYNYDLCIGIIAEGVQGGDIKNLQMQIDEIKESNQPQSITHNGYVKLFETNFEHLDDFNKLGIWSVANGASPNAIGNSTNIIHKSIYHVDDRYMRAIVGMKNDTFLRIPIIMTDIQTGNGASCFGIDFQSKRLIIYSCGDGSETQSYTSGYTNNILSYIEIPDNMIGNRDYLIEISKDNLTSKIVLADLLTGNKIEISYTGIACGLQNERYAFYLEKGTPFTLKKMSVYSLDTPDVVFVGDSITEGAQVRDRSRRYAEQYRTNNPHKRIVISARGADTIDGVLAKFQSEYNIYKPKIMSVLIGANNGNTLAKLQQLKENCDAIGCVLLLNRRTCQSNNSVVIEGNNLIASLGLDGARFDIATAKNNDPSQGYNSVLFFDWGHPTESGNDEMYKRLFIDLPTLSK